MAVFTGTSSANLLNGTSSADEISGLGGNDTLRGAGGNDTLIGGAGADRLVGGNGNDTYIIDATDTLIEVSGAGTDTVRANFSYTLLANFENLILTGAASINGTGNSVANWITGNGAANTLNGGGGNDTLIGGSGNDSLVGGAGNDRLDGGAGSDTMKRGAGNDTYVVNALGDVVTEAAAAGTDLIQSSVTIALLAANVENLTLTGASSINGTGNSLANQVTGNSAANVLSGGDGNDTLQGGGGNDTLLGGQGNDSLVGGAGDDTLSGGGGNDILVYQGDSSASGDGGTDTLQIGGSGITLDLTAIANNVYQDLEIIDLTGTGNNTLMLARADVIAFSSSTDTLRVDGNAGDVVETADVGWLRALNVKIGSETYAQYTNGAAVLQVDLNVDRSGIDTRVPVMQLSGLNGTNGFRLDGSDVYDFSGKAGPRRAM